LHNRQQQFAPGAPVVEMTGIGTSELLAPRSSPVSNIFELHLRKGFVMTQSQIDRAVARATGESVDLIQRRGFSLHCLPIPQRRQRRRRQRRSPAPLPKHGQAVCV
jgi:hypothetical protein